MKPFEHFDDCVAVDVDALAEVDVMKARRRHARQTLARQSVHATQLQRPQFGLICNVGYGRHSNPPLVMAAMPSSVTLLQ